MLQSAGTHGLVGGAFPAQMSRGKVPLRQFPVLHRDGSINSKEYHHLEIPEDFNGKKFEIRLEYRLVAEANLLRDG